MRLCLRFSGNLGYILNSVTPVSSFYSAPQCCRFKRCTSYGNSFCLSVCLSDLPPPDSSESWHVYLGYSSTRQIYWCHYFPFYLLNDVTVMGQRHRSRIRILRFFFIFLNLTNFTNFFSVEKKSQKIVILQIKDV